MCGNVGIINRELTKASSDKLISYFEQALFADTVRGKHGTGIAAIDGDGSINTYKKAMSAPDFLDLDRTKKLISGKNIFLSGHNRWATQGSHTDENTHPFRHNHITMFHNGTLNSTFDLPSGNKYTVDSNAIAHALSVQSVKKTLEDLDGAYALVWYNSEQKTINFARNEDRPLWFGKLKDSSSFIYASERDMMNWLSGRNNIELEDVCKLPVGRHIAVPLDSEEDVVITKFKPAEPLFNYGYGYGNRSSYKKNDNSLVGETFTCYAKSWKAYPNTDSLGSMQVNISKEGSIIECTISSIKKERGLSLCNTAISVRITSHTKSSIYGVLVSKPQGVPTEKSVSKELKRVNKELTVVDKVIKAKEEEYQSYGLTGVTDSDLIRLGPDLEFITQEEYDRLTKHGCSVCATDLLDEDDCFIGWDIMNNPYCPDCAKTELYL